MKGFVFCSLVVLLLALSTCGRSSSALPILLNRLRLLLTTHNLA
jgi:hypothetical protein